MRMPTAGLSDADERGDAYEDVVLATFWRKVTRKVQLNYPELSEDDVRERLSTLLCDVHAAARSRSADTRDRASDAQAISLVRAACSDVVARAHGGVSAARRGPCRPAMRGRRGPSSRAACSPRVDAAPGRYGR